MVRIEDGGGDWDAVDACVEAFEEAQALGGLADPADFLPPAEHPRYLDALGELLRVDLEYRWRRGEAQDLEHYRDRFPILFADPDRLSGVAFEEYRLRREAGHDLSPFEYSDRFGIDVDDWPSDPAGRADGDEGPEFESSLGGSSNGRRLAPPEAAAELAEELRKSEPVASFRLARAMDVLPTSGSRFLGFQLEAELGSGAFGRVFLARQGDLAGRPVALKISSDVAGESHALARLQHTNVMPIYSVHRAGPLQAVCMPYFGATTLADVAGAVGRRAGLPDSGADVVSAIEERRSRVVGGAARPVGDRAEPPASGSEAAALDRLRGLSYVQAILALVCRVADGLAHAHERGVVHRDLKPANILLADDGEPLILDFNLATDTSLRIRASAALVGGTLPYMAPEQLAAFSDKSNAVDCRADVYALGLILYELLTGHHPFEVRRGPLSEILPAMVEDRRAAPPDPRRRSRAVSPALSAIVRRCLEPDPARRYADARPLHEDLRRQLADLPLKHTREPSLAERLAKWSRRHPRLTSSTTIALVSVALIAGLVGALVVRQRRIEALAATGSLHQLAEDRVRAEVLLGARDAPPSQAAEGRALVDAILARYGDPADPYWVSNPLVAPLGGRDRAGLREDLGEVLYLAARAALWRGRTEEARSLSARSATAYGPGPGPRALWYLSADVARRSGDERLAHQLEEQAPYATAETHRHRLMLAADRLDRGQFGEALPFVLDASRRGPQDVATWALLGRGYASLGRLDEARHCLDTAISLRPDLTWLNFDRGLLALDRRDFRAALADFDRVLADRPDDPSALVNRALARLGLDDPAGVVEDLDAALRRPGTPARALFIRSLAKARLGDAEGARRDRDAGLAREPDDEASWVARGLARLPVDPEGALADFEAALRLNPTSFHALQSKAAVLSENLGRGGDAVRGRDPTIGRHPRRVRGRDGRGVLLARLGRRDEALRDAQAALVLDSTPETLYRVAGIYAQTSRMHSADRGQALRLLAAAVARDPSWLSVSSIDTDLDPIRPQAEFRTLLDALARIINLGP